MKSNKTLEIISKFQQVHGFDKYDYSKVDYKNNGTPVIITCNKHGVEFMQVYSSHFKGLHGCKSCSHENREPKDSKEEWLNKFKAIHGDKYDYSLFKNKYGEKMIQVVCKEHGVFNINKNNHSKGVGCGKCGGKHRTLSEWVDEFNKVHNFYYDYSLVVDSELKSLTKIQIKCPIHGVFTQTAKNHKRGDNCPKCHRRGITRDELVGEFKKVFGERYDYSQVKFDTLKDRVDVGCIDHGFFSVAIYQHLYQKVGCPYCNDVGIGFKKSQFMLLAEKKFNKLSNLYVLKFSNDEEEFYKVGVTFYDTKRRFTHQKNYKIEVLNFITSKAKDIWEMEKFLLAKVKDYKYLPKKSIGGGETECFSKITKEVQKCIDAYSSNSEGFLFDYVSMVINATSSLEVIACESLGGFVKVALLCDRHGEYAAKFDISTNNIQSHCQNCVIDGKTERFISEHAKKHGDLYTYGKSKYVNSDERISVICEKHGEFLVSPYFLNGCLKCTGRGRTVDEWISEFIKVHGNKYDYSKVTEISASSKVEIICSKHGAFFQYARKHREGNKCPECGIESMKKTKRKQFLEKSKKH